MWPEWSERVSRDVGVFRTALGLARDAELAMEAIHAAIIKLNPSVQKGRYQSYEHFRAAVRRCAVNWLIDRHRKQRREMPLGDHDLSGESTDPFLEIQEVIEQAINDLCERDRELIRRHYLQDQSLVEIAQQLNRAPQTVWDWFNEACDRFRYALLARGCEEYGWLNRRTVRGNRAIGGEVS